MRQTTSLRLVAMFLAVASTTGMATEAAAQSASEHMPAVATSGAAANRAGANGVQANGAEAFRSTGNTTAATESRSMLLDRRAAGLTRVVSDETTREAPMPRQDNDNSRTNTALMIVGAAAVVLGAAIGDEAGTVLIIGGAGIGLFGLYRWLN